MKRTQLLSLLVIVVLMFGLVGSAFAGGGGPGPGPGGPDWHPPKPPPCRYHCPKPYVPPPGSWKSNGELKLLVNLPYTVPGAVLETYKDASATGEYPAGTPGVYPIHVSWMGGEQQLVLWVPNFGTIPLMAFTPGKGPGDMPVWPEDLRNGGTMNDGITYATLSPAAIAALGIPTN